MRATNAICVIRPENDSTARTISTWWRRSEKRIPAGVQVYNVCPPHVTREEVETQVALSAVVVYFGHGTETSLEGDSSLLDSANINSAIEAIVVAIACRSASGLGQHAVMTGVSGYLGFTDDLLWADAFEQEFGTAITSGVIALLKGESLGTAERAIKIAFQELIDYFTDGDGKSHVDRPWGFMLALWNQDRLIGLGDLSAALH